VSTDLIQRLDKWLAAKRAPYYKELNPGASPQDLDGFEFKFEIKLPADFREFYQWRNGQSGYASFQFNLMFSPLADITDTKDTLDGMIGFDFEDPKWWRRSWIPFLNNGGGDHWCLDLTAEDGGTPGQILVFYHDDATRQAKHPSFNAWLFDLVASMESGKYKIS
jgi:cell wall assembly regulator SMI1